jgi:hypothetical protein
VCFCVGVFACRWRRGGPVHTKLDMLMPWKQKKIHKDQNSETVLSSGFGVVFSVPQ